MNVSPKRWHTGEPKRVLWHGDHSGIVIECEAISPKSAAGRTVWVHITGEDVEHFMKELRDLAIARRSQSMEETVHASGS